MEPNIKEPLLFFEKSLSPDFINRKWEEFKEDFCKFNSYWSRIEGNNLILDTEYIDYNGEIKKVYIEENFETDFLKPIFDVELKRVYSIIDTIKEETINESSNKSLEIKLRVRIFDKIDALIDNRKELIEKFPIFLNCFERVKNYINYHCKKYLEVEFKLDKSPIVKTRNDDFETIVDKIFLPLKLAIENKHITNTKEELDYFVDCMKLFVYDKNFEPIQEKFKFRIRPESHLKYIIGRYIKRFKYQYTIEEVVNFVNKIIVNFNENPSSLSKHYNDRPRNLDSFSFITDDFREIE